MIPASVGEDGNPGDRKRCEPKRPHCAERRRERGAWFSRSSKRKKGVLGATRNALFRNFISEEGCILVSNGRAKEWIFGNIYNLSL